MFIYFICFLLMSFEISIAMFLVYAHVKLPLYKCYTETYSYKRVTTKVIAQLNIGFNMLKIFLATLGYCKVCVKCVIQKLTQEQKSPNIN